MNTLIYQTFSRHQVEHLDYSQFDAIYSHWPQLWGRELRGKYNSLVFAVDGFNAHPDEIYTISEVRRFYRELHRRWPWWLFFLSNIGDNIPVIYLCLLDSIESRKVDGSKRCAAVFDPKEVIEIIKHDIGRMSYLMEIAGMSEAEEMQRTEEILRLFTKGVSNG